jgi:hypothetical protein
MLLVFSFLLKLWSFPVSGTVLSHLLHNSSQGEAGWQLAISMSFAFILWILLSSGNQKGKGRCA